MKKRSCLFCSFALLFSFVELKTTKTSSEAKNCLSLKCFFVPSRSFCGRPLMSFGGQCATKKYELLRFEMINFSYQNKQLNRQALRFSALSEQNRSCGAYTSPKPRLWTAYGREEKLMFVRPSVLRKIIDFCEGDLWGVTRLLSTGSLHLWFWAVRKWIAVNEANEYNQPV